MALFDPGLQPERTLLAWRRTCLAAAVAAAVLTRLTAHQIGLAGVLTCLAGLSLASLAWLGANLRYRTILRGLRTDPSRLPVGGLPIAALCASAGLAATMSLAALIASHA